MFGEKFKRVVSMALIFGMIATGNGFTTLAASVDDVVLNAEMESMQEGQKNYYEMMYEEYYEEKTVITNNNFNSGDESEGESKTVKMQKSLDLQLKKRKKMMTL